MSNFNVTNSATQVAGQAALIQNLGPDDLYVDPSSSVTVGNGLRVAAGKAVAVTGSVNYYAISEGTSDVRVLVNGISGPSS